MSEAQELIEILQKKVELKATDMKDKYISGYQSAENLLVTAISAKLIHDGVISNFDSDEKRIYEIVINSMSVEAKVTRTKPSSLLSDSDKKRDK